MKTSAPKKEMIIFVGNIGSGKSTLAKHCAERGYIIISRDALRYSIGAGTYIFNTNYEPAISKINLKMISEFAKLGVPLAIDETNMTKSIRKRYITIAKKNKYDSIVAFVLPKLSKKLSLDRRMKNPHTVPIRKYWARVWDMFNNIYEEPSLKEGYTYIHRAITKNG